MALLKTPEEGFIKNIESYLDITFDIYSRNRILTYLKEYREEIPSVIVKEKVVEQVKYVEPERILTEEDLVIEAKAICKLYKINYLKFLRPESGKSTSQYTSIRKEFCRNILETYISTRRQLQDFFDIDHTTVLYYVSRHYKPKYKRKTA